MKLKLDLDKARSWRKYETNRWIDFIELNCLYGEDRLVSHDDVLLWLNDLSADQSSSGDESVDIAAESDSCNARIDDFFSRLKYREKMFGEQYPFFVKERNLLEVKPDKKSSCIIYEYLLLCSSIAFIGYADRAEITRSFEKICSFIFKTLMPPIAKTEIFGTSEKSCLFQGRDLKGRIEELAKFLGTQTSKVFDKSKRYHTGGGDSGLDIVACVQLDNAQNRPFAFGQCTCSYVEWKKKQESISQDKWNKILSPLLPYWQFMYVPFSCRDAVGELEDIAEVQTCVIDRERILKLVGYLDQDEISEVVETVKKYFVQ